MIRLAILPFAIATIVIAAALLVWALSESSSQWEYVWRDAELALLWVSPFTALGLLLLVPVAWLTDRITLGPKVRFATMLFAGGALGTLLMLPLAERLTFDLLMGTAAGAVSAGIWTLLNPDRIAKR
jgi:hypothetical protein